MKNLLNKIPLYLVVVALALVSIASTGVETATRFYHSNSLAVTASSQTVQTTRMRQSDCTGWQFRNRSETETFYLNLNVADGYNGAAQVTDVNMYPLGSGEILELQDALIKRFSVIGTGSGELYWFCGCK